jgi:hypothetical protein
MNTATLLAGPSAIKLTYIRPDAGSITVVVKTTFSGNVVP